MGCVLAMGQGMALIHNEGDGTVCLGRHLPLLNLSACAQSPGLPPPTSHRTPPPPAATPTA